MTDNGSAYVSTIWADTLESVDIAHVRIPPRRPHINGKVCDYRLGWCVGLGLTLVKV